MRAYERLLKYVVYRTPSDETSGQTPSSSCQFDLAHALVDEMKAMGIEDAFVDEFCYVYGHLPATEGMEAVDSLGFIAHMDTVSDYCDHDIVPVITENYNGQDLPLGTSGKTLTTKMFPHIAELKGQTLITTDGTTVLGADDKAGIAEILTMVEILIEKQLPHGPISIAFTPDEEIGEGSDHFNLEVFNAKYGYTADGETEGEIQFENFNAGAARVTFEGVNVHPGAAKDTMVNAALVAMEFNSMLPSADTPRDTEGYEGFFHLVSMSGDVAHAELSYIIRDLDGNMYACRKTMLEHITKILNAKWGEGTVKLELREQYSNMKEIIDGCPQLIEYAKIACEEAGVAPLIIPIRGGTDGAQLSFKGLPCPNIGTGGHAYHGPYEHITVEAMDKSVDVLLGIVKAFR